MSCWRHPFLSAFEDPCQACVRERGITPGMNDLYVVMEKRDSGWWYVSHTESKADGSASIKSWTASPRWAVSFRRDEAGAIARLNANYYMATRDGIAAFQKFKESEAWVVQRLVGNGERAYWAYVTDNRGSFDTSLDCAMRVDEDAAKRLSDIWLDTRMRRYKDCEHEERYSPRRNRAPDMRRKVHGYVMIEEGADRPYFQHKPWRPKTGGSELFSFVLDLPPKEHWPQAQRPILSVDATTTSVASSVDRMDDYIAAKVAEARFPAVETPRVPGGFGDGKNLTGGGPLWICESCSVDVRSLPHGVEHRCAKANPEPKPFTYDLLQREHVEWTAKNFPGNPQLATLVGMTEEICDELAEAIEKSLPTATVDACVDAFIYMTDLCIKMGVKVGDVVQDEREWGSYATAPSAAMYHKLTRELGRLSRSQLKWHQRIRGTQEKHRTDSITSMRIIATQLQILVRHTQGITSRVPFIDLVEKTWKEVKARDWTKDPARKAEG